MGLWDDVKKNINDKITDKKEKLSIAYEKNKREYSKRIKKFKSQYLLLEPVKNSDIIGMRLFRVCTQHIPFVDADLGYIIEFWKKDGKRAYLYDETVSVYDVFDKVSSADSVLEVCEALQEFIPRFDDEKIYTSFVADDAKRDLTINKLYLSKFADKNNYSKYTEIQKEKIDTIVNEWKSVELLNVVGRDNFDAVEEVINKESDCIGTKNTKKSEKTKIKNADMVLADDIKDNNNNINYEKNTEKDFKTEAGEKGEAKVRYALSWLPQDYKIIQGDNNEKLYLINEDFRDERQEYDHIVVGPNGLFLIETKNYGGIVRIDSHGNWTQQKNDEKVKGLKNPRQQVIQHEKLIKSFIEENIPVHSIICIANEKTLIEGIENSSVPIVKCDQIQQYIEDFYVEKRLTKKVVNECLKNLKRHIVV